MGTIVSLVMYSAQLYRVKCRYSLPTAAVPVAPSHLPEPAPLLGANSRRMFEQQLFQNYQILMIFAEKNPRNKSKDKDQNKNKNKYNKYKQYKKYYECNKRNIISDKHPGRTNNCDSSINNDSNDSIRTNWTTRNASACVHTFYVQCDKFKEWHWQTPWREPMDLPLKDFSFLLPAWGVRGCFFFVSFRIAAEVSAQQLLVYKSNCVVRLLVAAAWATEATSTTSCRVLGAVQFNEHLCAKHLCGSCICWYMSDVSRLEVKMIEHVLGRWRGQRGSPMVTSMVKVSLRVHVTCIIIAI